MTNLLPTIINSLFYIISGVMSLILLLSVYIFIRYSLNRIFASILSLIIITLFLTGIMIAFGTAQQIIKIYA